MKRKLPKNSFSSVQVLFFILVCLVGIVGWFFVREYRSGNICANSKTCIENLTGSYDPSGYKGIFLGNEIIVPQSKLETPDTSPVLGESTGNNKRILIDLANQKLFAFEGDKLIYDFLISSGKWGRTPTGDFRIWIKLRYTRMSGGNQALGTYYNLPNVPYTMFFYNDEIPKSRGYGIHGAYWHNNFGHPMSHGCINMREEDVAQLYYWADPPSVKNVTYASEEQPGTPITIYGVAPNE